MMGVNFSRDFELQQIFEIALFLLRVLTHRVVLKIQYTYDGICPLDSFFALSRPYKILNLFYMLVLLKLYQKALGSFGDNDKYAHLNHSFSLLASPLIFKFT